jgi:dTDP-4-dehydrorhamnose 3,5-epimerase
MPFIKTDFPGLFVFEPKVFGDARGYFFESYNHNTFKEAALEFNFIQDNQARSVYGVVRGLHYQLPPYAQTKLIRALEGRILDVVVDVRQGSPTQGKVFSIELSADNKKQLLVPKGFAHGYSVLSPTAEVLYKCDEFYHPETEGGIVPTDPALAINWGIPQSDMIFSAKDPLLPAMEKAERVFVFEK